MRKWLFVWLLLPALAHAQAEDSVQWLSLTDLLALSREYHPILRQAALQADFAEAELRGAKGAFDPKIQSSLNLKNNNGTEYYNKFYNTLKVPFWFPIDPKVEVYRNRGDYLNPESYVSGGSDYWQVTTGVSLPLGKGLFIDERRTLVKQAQLYSNLAEAEQIKLTNKTLLMITKAYWDWYLAYRQYDLMERSMRIAEELFGRVKMDYQFGEAAVVDTIQAKITWQNRRVDYEKAKLALMQARLGLSVHLWADGLIPMELAENVAPMRENQVWIVPADSSLETLTQWAQQRHPDVVKLSTKQAQLEVQRRWNVESLKPEINLSYSLLDAPITLEGTQPPQWTDNYKLGVDFSIPLFLRKERANLQKTQLYLQSTEWELLQTKQEVVAQVRYVHAQLRTNETLAAEYESMAANYDLLLQAELFNLETGESDLFKLNIQQDKLIESQLKYLDALVKLEKLKAELPYTVGLPDLSYQALYE